MNIAIVGRQNDPICRHTVTVAKSAGHEAHLIDLSGATALAFDGEAWIVGQHEISTFDAFIVRSYPAHVAVLGDDANAALTVDEAWQRSMRQRDRHEFAVGCLMALDRLGKPMVNPLSSCLAFDSKPLQLATMFGAHVRVPRTLVTNFPTAVRAFAEDVEEVIFKPVGGGAETRVLDGTALATLDAALAGTPLIFQERIRGEDIRVTIVGDEIVSSVAIPSHDVDYRLGESYRKGEQRYVDHPLAADVAETCLRVAKLNQLVLAGIDLKRNGAGEYFVLEANSAPVYLDIELKTGAAITRRIVEWLAASARSNAL
jgi:glutathione synthase/RimK-type ligase-like ATP-grasp enzyme